MSDLDLRADGEHRYLAVVTADDGSSSEHVVEVPEPLLADLGLEAADEPLLVRTALDLLLDGSGPALPGTVRLDEVEDSRPGFTDRLRTAAGR